MLTFVEGLVVDAKIGEWCVVSVVLTQANENRLPALLLPAATLAHSVIPHASAE